MYVCICEGITDRQIREHAEKNDCETLADLMGALAVGTCCGKCIPEASRILHQARESRAFELTER